MTADEVTKLLFVRDEPERACLALVFGQHDPEISARRTRHAAGLYRDGFAPKLLLSGGETSGTSRMTEMAHMARVAESLGVQADDVWLEPRARNTIKNVMFSLALIEAQNRLGRTRTTRLVQQVGDTLVIPR